ncbi:unnamed protein product [Lupinus luteus]|uniref:Pentatricopeptide repeat-containing protein n=1 Tax=Lupinus luteus TaxID=3873 RepID=A0AAV1WHP6_LUPLU
MLINKLMKYGFEASAYDAATELKVFDKTPKWNVVAWICLKLPCFEMYAKFGILKTAIDLFNKVYQRNIVAWNIFDALALGQTVHAYVLKSSIRIDIAMATALLNSYVETRMISGIACTVKEMKH